MKISLLLNYSEAHKCVVCLFAFPIFNGKVAKKSNDQGHHFLWETRQTIKKYFITQGKQNYLRDMYIITEKISRGLSANYWQNILQSSHTSFLHFDRQAGEADLIIQTNTQSLLSVLVISIYFPCQPSIKVYLLISASL